jgi:4a-hydroxytetrahydrobiopterin dehydratase
MSSLAALECVPCKGGVPPLDPAACAALIERLGGGWELALDARRLLKTYAFRDFAEGLGFVNLVGALAESVNHHPDLYLAWGRVRVEIWTHKIDGLTESDFVFAAKCDALLT